MTPDALLRSPMMFHCRPYAVTMHRRWCAYNWLNGREYCQECQQGARMRQDYPDFVRQAKLRLQVKKSDKPKSQDVMRRANTASILDTIAHRVTPWAGR